MVAVEVEGGVLVFTVDGFVGFLNDPCAGCFGALEVGVHVINENSQALGCVAEFSRALKAGLRLIDHDDGAAGVELRAAEGVAVAIVLGESEGGGEPGDGGGEILIDDVREHGVDGDGAVLRHGKKVAPRDVGRQVEVKALANQAFSRTLGISLSERPKEEQAEWACERGIPLTEPAKDVADCPLFIDTGHER